MSAPSVPPGSAAGSQGASASAGGGPYAKLDGVLYHFYAKTSSVITHNRFTHIVDSRRSSQVAGPSGSTGASSSQTPQRQASTRKPGKWFALEVEDSDIFRDEIRLWRSVSAFIPAHILHTTDYEAETSTSSQSPVPSLVLDVILDTSALAPEQYLVIEEGDDEPHTAPPTPGSRPRRRVHPLTSDDHSSGDNSGSTRHEVVPIVLETWHLDFHARRMDDPPDLPTLYRNSTAHFKELLGVVKTLPAYRLRQQLQNERADPEPMGQRSILKIGARLAVDHSTATEDGLIGLHQDLAGSAQRGGAASEIVPASRSFAPVTTPLGTLATSVEYRANVAFYVEDTRMVEGLQEAALDADYFSTGGRRHSGHARDTSSIDSQRVISSSDRKKSLLSTLSQQSRQSPAATAGSAQASDADLFGGQTSGPSTKTVPATVSPAPGRPVAGLSGLRSIPSNANYSATAPTSNVLPHTTGTALGTSPVLPSTPGTEAAFLTHGRRSSASERRLRPVSQSSGGGGIGGEGTSSRENAGSPAINSPLASRPILSRAAASSQAGIGSYSPSSPSPLAQQLYAQQSAIAGSSSSRYSSSPSYRAPAGAATMSSISPSLRSVFQTGPASVSQTSQSSLSRTPPRYLTDGKDGSSSQSGARATSRQASYGEPYHAQNTSSQTTSFSPSSLRQASVAPQMIKRYSSNFSYRHGRQGASLESEASDGNSSFNAPYSQSWQARIEQRQNFAARSLGRDERRGQGSSESLQSQGMRRVSPQSANRPTSYATGSKSNDEDLQDLMRMFDSKGALFAGEEQGSIPGVDVSERRESRSSQGEAPATTDIERSRADAARNAASTSVNERIAPSSNPFAQGQSLNRSDVDNMLLKMQQSVQGFEASFKSMSNRESPASGGLGSSSGGRSQSDYPVAPTGTSPLAARSPLSQATVVSAAGLGGARKFATLEYGRRLGTPSSGEASQGDSAQLAGNAPRTGQERAAFATPSRSAHYRGLQARDRQVETDVDDIDDSAGEQSSRHEERLSRSHPGRDTSRSSIELYGPSGPQTYDPLEDETAGRLELAGDDATTERESYLVGRMGVPRLGSVQSALQQPESVQSRRSRSQRSGAARTYGDYAVDPASGVASASGSSPGGDAGYAIEGDQRYQRSLVHQFGHSIGASSARGHSSHASGGAFATTGRALHHTHSIHTQTGARASMSPWRQRGFHPASAATMGGNGGAHAVGSPGSTGIDRMSSPSGTASSHRYDTGAAAGSHDRSSSSETSPLADDE